MEGGGEGGWGGQKNGDSEKRGPKNPKNTFSRGVKNHCFFVIFSSFFEVKKNIIFRGQKTLIFWGQKTPLFLGSKIAEKWPKMTKNSPKMAKKPPKMAKNAKKPPFLTPP